MKFFVAVIVGLFILQTLANLYALSNDSTQQKTKGTIAIDIAFLVSLITWGCILLFGV